MDISNVHILRYTGQSLSFFGSNKTLVCHCVSFRPSNVCFFFFLKQRLSSQRSMQFCKMSLVLISVYAQDRKMFQKYQGRGNKQTNKKNKQFLFEAIQHYSLIDFLADRNSLQLVYSPALPVLPCTSQPHVHSLAEGRNLN